MAKGWLGRSRAQSNEPPAGNIGQPNLTWSDAEPRSDLQQLGEVTPTMPPANHSDKTATTNIGERPRTAGDHSKSKTHVDVRPNLPTAQTFDFELQRPRPPHLDLQSPTSEDVIGMAIGSPTNPQFRQAKQPIGQSRLATQSGGQNAYDEHDEHFTKAKGGKWKKLGGLFKAKAILTPQTPTTPFYSLQPQNANQFPLPSQESKPSPYQQSPDYTVPLRTQQITGGLNSHSRKTSPPGVEVERRKYSTDASLSQSRARSKSEVGSHKQSSSKGSSEPMENDYKFFERSPLFLNSMPSLDIEIPDASMERYSVMFGHLLGNSNSSNLLARRSRMLEKLKTISDEAENTVTEPVPGLPRHPKDQAHLAPQPQHRRATSPTPNKSPTFSLFPQPPSGGTPVESVSDSKPNPLQRSFTAPGRPSPRAETFNFDLDLPTTDRAPELVDSPGQTTASGRGPKYSSDSSYLSPASTATSVHQDEDIIFDVKALSYLGENNEQQWEMVSTEKVNELNLLMRRARGDDKKISPLATDGLLDQDWSVSSPRANDEALAALEAPPPPGQDLKPLLASKAAVDRIMSPPPKEKVPFPQVKSIGYSPRDVIPNTRTRSRANTSAAQRPMKSALVTKPSIEHLVTAVKNDLDDLEQQIESRAVNAMKKQTRKGSQTDASHLPHLPASPSTLKRNPPVRSATADNASSQSRIPRVGRGSSANLNKAKSLDSIAATAKVQLSGQAPPIPAAVKRVSPLDMVQALSPSPSLDDEHDADEREVPGFRVTGPQSMGEVQVARSISVSRRQRQLLVPIGGHRNQSDENLVEKTAQGPLMPQIIDVANTAAVGKERGHRYERSQNAVVESA